MSQTVKVVYDGPQPSRTAELGDGRRLTFEKGKGVDCSPEDAKRLDKEAYFTAVKGSSGKPTVKELRARAESLGAEVPPKATKTELERLIHEAEQTKANEPEEAPPVGVPAEDGPVDDTDNEEQQ